MPRIDPSRQDSMSESILRFYHNQNWAKIEFLYEICRKSTRPAETRHSLLTSKSEVGCEALSSHDKICFKCNKQKERAEKQRCKENMSVRMERDTCMYIYVYNYIDA